MPKNIIQKIWDAHIISHQEGHPAVLGIDRLLLHEVTSSQAFDEIRRRHLSVHYPQNVIATVDHSIPTTSHREEMADPNARQQVEALRNNAKAFGIKLYDLDSPYQGIVHVIGPELGFTLPGMTVVCGDSHTSTHGAFGALAFGIGTTEVAHVLATGAILQAPLKTMKVVFKGNLPVDTTPKDLVMKFIAAIGVDGAKGYIIEYTGDAIRNLSMEGRMTICNMSIECGARAGLVAPDEKTVSYLQNTHAELDDWQTWVSDPGCDYDRIVELDVSRLSPMVTWGIHPGQAIGIDELLPKIPGAEQAYQYTGLKPGQPIKNVAIDWAFIGSCTNGRIEDLRLAARVLEGKKISKQVRLLVVPGSQQVREQAVREGLDIIFKDAGADFRLPGCSMCIAMNDDRVPLGARCISTSNRNFIGRQGPGSITHLASPATVAASAIAGYITCAEEVG